MRYRSTPQEIEAVQWTGSNPAEAASFAPEIVVYEDGQLFILAGKDGAQGLVPVPVGHWIVRSPGDMSDHWPVDPDYFARKYEPVKP